MIDAIELTGEQQAAIDMVVEGGHRTCCLTGGPGTGKSTTIRELVRRLRAQGRTVALAAPSGKAALRLQEAAGFPAATLHRLLRLQPGKVNEPAPLMFEFVVIDEMSMCDAELLGEVVRSAEAGTVRTLLLVGDADQLPPVGAGCPFLDLLASGQVPTTRLTQIQRQAEKSGIIRAAHAIRGGRCPDWAPDFELLEVPEADRIPDVVHRFLLAEEWSPDDTLILAPKHDGPCGVKALCDRLERAQTPAVATPVLLRGLFRKGTRVIQTANNYEFGVFNGELGWVEKVTEGPGKKRSEDEVVVSFSGRPPCAYRGGEIGQLLPAWALTVHRCVHPDTLVATDKGLLPIASIPGEGQIATAEGPRPYLNRVQNPEGPGLRITTRRGYELLVTRDHRMAVDVGGQVELIQAQHLLAGQTLRLVRGPSVGAFCGPILPAMPARDVRAAVPPRLPVALDESVAEFFGLMVGDGTLYQRGFRLVKRHREVVDRFAFLVNEIFGMTAKVGRASNGNAFSATCNSTALSAWIAQVGGMRPNEKAVPVCVLRSPASMQRAFLRGLFEDGSAHVKKRTGAGAAPGETNFSHVEWSTSYERMGQVVQTMLLHLGIVSARKQVHKITPALTQTTAWRLWLYGREAAKFRDEIGFITPAKQERLAGAGHSINDLAPIELEAIKSVEPISMPSMCVEVPGHGRFLQNGFDGSNSQGSEARNVVVVAHKGHAFMLTRSLLYVAVTRAKERVVVVGDSCAVEQAVRTVRDQKRSTMLSRLFKADRDAAAKADVA